MSLSSHKIHGGRAGLLKSHSDYLLCFVFELWESGAGDGSYHMDDQEEGRGTVLLIFAIFFECQATHHRLLPVG